MARYTYDRLTALDASFLMLEKATAYMHVASTQIFEAGPLRNAAGGIDADAVKDLTASQLHRIPRYRQKLAYIPIEARPVWVDDDRFNLSYHIRHTSLPRPGTEEQLKRLSARIMQQHLDRSRPLWEMWVIEGLEGDRFALVSKVHHCMIDGVSGIDLMKILMTLEPEHELPEPPPFIPKPAPTRTELLRDELLRRARLPLDTLRDARSFLREAQDARREIGFRLRAVRETLGQTLRLASATPINEPIGPHRRFDWLSMEIAEIKAIRKRLGGSLNDVVLTVTAGAVRRFMERRQVNPRTLDFRVMAPVSVRTEDERGAFGNRVSAWLVDLPVGEDDPRARLEAIARQTERLKQSKQAVGAEVLTQVAEWTPSTLLALGARNATRLLAFNMVVTNVPGPQVPMYMLGARMLEVYPHVPLADYLGLGIALLSYDGKIFWGFNADYDLVPDVKDLVGAVRTSFEELRRVALGPPPVIRAAAPAEPTAGRAPTAQEAAKTRAPRSPRPV